MARGLAVGPEAGARREHAGDGAGVHAVRLGLPEAQALAVEVGGERVEDVGVKPALQKEAEDVVAVVPGGLQAHAHRLARRRARDDGASQALEALAAVGDREHVLQDLPAGPEDEAVVLVLRDVDAYRDHVPPPGTVPAGQSCHARLRCSKWRLVGTRDFGECVAVEARRAGSGRRGAGGPGGAGPGGQVARGLTGLTRTVCFDFVYPQVKIRALQTVRVNGGRGRGGRRGRTADGAPRGKGCRGAPLGD